MISTTIDLQPAVCGKEIDTTFQPYISPSRIGLWMRCPRAFELRYVEGIRSPVSPSLFLGKVVHAALETYYRHLQLGLELAGDEIDDAVESAWDDQMRDELLHADHEKLDKLKAQAHALVARYAESYRGVCEKVIATETPICAPLVDPETGENLGMNLYGIIDLILQEQSGDMPGSSQMNTAGDQRERTTSIRAGARSGCGPCRVVDFKTSAQASQRCELQHELQLTGYAYLVGRITGGENPLLEIRQLVKTKTPKIVGHCYAPRTEKHFRRFFGIVREFLDALDSGKFNPRPGFGCGMCDMQHECLGG